MFRPIRSVLLLAAAFYAGMLFERADAGETCKGSADWGTYLSCVAGEMF